MGYRNYIASITKKEYDKIKNFTKEQLFEYKGKSLEDEYVGVYEIGDKDHYGLGKYVDSFDKKLFKPVFLNKELQDYYLQEHDLYIVGKEFMRVVINRYAEEIKAYYKELTAPFFNGNKCVSDFLNSVKTEYGSVDDTYTFDMSKITKDEQTTMFLIIDHLRTMATEWGVCTNEAFEGRKPYDLDKGEEVTTSWKYEYAQFELVRIYKTFDWENNLMLYYGY